MIIIAIVVIINACLWVETIVWPGFVCDETIITRRLAVRIGPSNWYFRKESIQTVSSLWETSLAELPFILVMLFAFSPPSSLYQVHWGAHLQGYRWVSDRRSSARPHCLCSLRCSKVSDGKNSENPHVLLEIMGMMWENASTIYIYIDNVWDNHWTKWRLYDSMGYSLAKVGNRNELR